MLTDTITKLPQKIVNFFEKETERLGKLTKYKQRHSKLTPQAFIKALLTVSFCPHFDLEILSSFLKEEGVSITKQGVHERFNKQTEAFVKAISSKSLVHIDRLRTIVT